MNLPDLLRVEEARRTAASGEARRLRIGARLTLGEVAAACGVTSTSVLRWERGERVPRGRAALRYARLLETLTRVAS